MVRSRSYIATPPGATIKEQLNDRGMSQKEFAARMDMSEKHISKLINGEVQLTPDVAVRLEMVLGIPAQFWSKLEAIYREKLAKVKIENELDADVELMKKFPYKEMANQNWVPQTLDVKEKVINLRKFFEVVKLTLVQNSLHPSIACRRVSETEKADYALIAWAQKAKLDARNIETRSINLKKLQSSLQEIRLMTRLDPKEFCPRLISLLANCGVALVFLPHIGGSFLHGATFCDKNQNPYLVYLTEGEHKISLTVTSGPIYEVSMLLKDTVAELGDIYMDITMITGETVDNYRDYDLFDSIENLDGRINTCLESLNKASGLLSNIGNQGTSSYDSSIKSMAQILSKMLENKYTAHRYLNDYYSKYCSVASVLNEMRSMPLYLDRIYLVPQKAEADYNEAGFFTQLWFSVVKFIQSFSADYNTVSDAKSGDSITIWVNWGRDQAQVLNSLVQSSFTPKYGTNVEIEVVNATMVQAVLSGNPPDCILQHSRSEPVNLAMRGVLLDLERFDNLDEILNRFQKGAEKPYRYKGGLYALPDTQNFYLMFYRKDIFGNLGLTVPETWDEFITVTKVLARNNLQSWLHYTQITAANQIDMGVGSLNLFPSMLLQRGLNLYEDDYRSTTLDSSKVIKTFEYWTNFYTKLKIPVTLSFYNRFRTGTCPIGIEPYTTYTTLKAAAPEIEGLWSVAPIPGVKNADGTVSHISTGGGTGCAILKSTKNPEKAWDFITWWTDAETQYSYTQNVEASLGPTGRIAVSNIEAFNKMSWDSEMKSEILNAWSQVEEVPEVPGSYYASRSIDLSFWSVVNENRNPKDVLLEKSAEVNYEIERKWEQYENRAE